MPLLVGHLSRSRGRPTATPDRRPGPAVAHSGPRLGHVHGDTPDQACKPVVDPQPVCHQVHAVGSRRRTRPPPPRPGGHGAGVATAVPDRFTYRQIADRDQNVETASPAAAWCRAFPAVSCPYSMMPGRTQSAVTRNRSGFAGLVGPHCPVLHEQSIWFRWPRCPSRPTGEM